VIAVALAAVLSAAPAGKHLTMIFTGDDGGEIAPCG
jgi:hypothetical protein